MDFLTSMYGRARNLERRIREALTAGALDPSALDELVLVRTQIVECLPRDAQERAFNVILLARAISQRASLKQSPDDLDMVVRLLETEAGRQGSVQEGVLTDELQQQRVIWARALRDRFKHRGEIADVNEAIGLLREIGTTVLTKTRAEAFATLASCLRFRFRIRGDRQSADRAVAADQEAADAARETGRDRDLAFHLYSLGLSLRLRFEYFGSADDLSRAKKVATEALRLTPFGDRYDATRKAMLAGVLRHEAGKALTRQVATDVLDRAIRLHHEALREGNPHANDRPWGLTELATCHLLRHERTGAPEDRATAVSRAWEAWSARGDAMSIGLLDTAVILQKAIGTDRREWERLGNVLIRANEVLDAVLTGTWIGDDWIHRTSAQKYEVLRDALVDWHLTHADAAREACDQKLVASHALKAYHVIERTKQRALIAHMDAGALQPSTGAEATARALLTVHEKIEALVRTGTEETASSNPAQGPGPDTGTHDDTRIDERHHTLRQEAGRLQRLLYRLDPTYAEAKGFVPPETVESVAASVPHGTTVVVLYPMPERTVVIGLAPGDGNTGVKIGITAAQYLTRERIRDWTSSMMRVDPNRADAHSGQWQMTRILNGLSKHLIPALASVITDWMPATQGAVGPTGQSLRNLIFVPTGHLHRIPLHALPITPQLPGSPFGSPAGERLIDRFAISYASTSDILPRAHRRTASPDGVAAVAPGACDRDGSHAPHMAVGMAQAIASRAGSRAIVRGDATIDAVTNGRVLAGRRLGFIATHGRPARRGSDAQAGILLHDGDLLTDHGSWLVASRIIVEMHLHGVDHLQLLACETHANDPESGDHLSGLLTSIIMRGARSVGGTLWKVDETKAICVGWWLAEALRTGATDKATAMRTATLRLRDATSSEIAGALRDILAVLADAPATDVRSIMTIREKIATLEEQPARGLHSVDDKIHEWAPYVLHGAPTTAPPPNKVFGGGAGSSERLLFTSDAS